MILLATENQRTEGSQGGLERVKDSFPADVNASAVEKPFSKPIVQSH
jgi:hypothetical protein